MRMVVMMIVFIMGVAVSNDRRPARRGEAVCSLVLQPVHDLIQPLAAYQIREHEWTLAPLPPSVTIHHFKRRAHMRRQVDFIDHQQAATPDTGSALSRNLV